MCTAPCAASLRARRSHLEPFLVFPLRRFPPLSLLPGHMPPHEARCSASSKGFRNGLITNDKFCLSRYGRLKLNWSRYDVYLKRKDGVAKCSTWDKQQDYRRSDETPMASPSPDESSNRRTTALGSRLPTAGTVGNAPANDQDEGGTP